MSSSNKFPLHAKIKISPTIVKRIALEAKQLKAKNAQYRHYLVDGEVSIIPLISPDGKIKNLHGFSNGENFYETKYLKDCPHIKSFLNTLPGKKYSCRISTLNGQSEIHPHRDYFRSLDFGVVRLHLPLKTHKDISFNFDKKKYNLEAGSLHFVDISQVHYLENPTNRERVHLIIDLEVTIELLERFHLSKYIKKLPYLNLPKNFQDVRFKKIKVKIDINNLPFPLSTSKSNLFEISCIDDEYFFTGENFKYDVVKTVSNYFYLPALGPGFYFYFDQKNIIFHCHGVATLSKVGVVNLSKKVILPLTKKMSTVLQRERAIVEGETVNKDIFLFNLEDRETFVILDKNAIKLWKLLLTPTGFEKIESRCKIIYKNNSYYKVIKKLKEIGFINEYLFYN